MEQKALKKTIKDFISEKLSLEKRVKDLKNKFNNGDRHPFLISLTGGDDDIAFKGKVAHSIYTSFGMSFYEQLCALLASNNGYEVETKKKILGSCNSEVEKLILSIILQKDYQPNREKELQKLRNIVTPGEAREMAHSTVDVYIKTPDKKEILIDITTVKNNKKSFISLKQKILRWTAMRLSQDINSDIEAYFAIPYNPYSKIIENTDYTNPFSKWVDRKDILVGDELWKKVSNNKIGIKDINEVFIELSREINFSI